MDESTKSRMKTIAGAVAAVFIGAGLGYFASGDEPHVADITCAAAAAVVASEACQEDAASDEPEGEAEEAAAAEE